VDITTQELREQIIHPTLEYLGKSGLGAENVLVAIASQKQKLMSLKQYSSKGLGPFDIDSHMHQTVWDKYLAFHPELASRIRGLASQRAFLENPHSELATNLCYTTSIAWVIYILRPSEILSSVA
jgi:hypothetical protein